MTEHEELAKVREAERRAALEDMATECIAEVRAWSAAHPQAKWDELEEAVLRARQRFGERLLQAVVEERAEVRPVPGPPCAQCGTEMHYKGPKSRYVVSSLGETQLERGYYYCPQCKVGVFPPR